MEMAFDLVGCRNTQHLVPISTASFISTSAYTDTKFLNLLKMDRIWMAWGSREAACCFLLVVYLVILI